MGSTDDDDDDEESLSIDDDGDDLDLLEPEELVEIKSELGEHLGRILAKRGLKGSDVAKLFAGKPPAVSPAASTSTPKPAAAATAAPIVTKASPATAAPSTRPAGRL
jgi:hypothetical protein